MEDGVCITHMTTTVALVDPEESIDNTKPSRQISQNNL